MSRHGRGKGRDCGNCGRGPLNPGEPLVPGGPSTRGLLTLGASARPIAPATPVELSGSGGPPSPPPPSDRPASRAERILAVCDSGIISVPETALLDRDRRDVYMADFELLQGSPHQSLPHRQIIPLLDALATLLVSQASGEIVAVGYIPTTDNGLHLVLAQNGSPDKLQAAGLHLKEICTILKDIRATRESQGSSNVPPHNKVPAGLAFQLLKSCYRFSAACVRKYFEKAGRVHMLEALQEAQRNKYTPEMEHQEAKPRLRRAQWTLIGVLEEMLSMCKELGESAWENIGFFHKISDVNASIRALGHHMEFLDDILPYHLDQPKLVRYGSKFQRLTDKLLAVDTSIRNILILPFSGSMGRVLGTDNLDISQARTDEESYLNYNLATDKELKAMMDSGISPLSHDELRDILRELPPGRGERRAYKLFVHAECKLLAYFVDEEISAYPYIGMSKLACVACWLFFEAYNEVVTQRNQKRTDRRLDVFHIRGCHSHVYQWAAPDFSLRDTILDSMAPHAERFYRTLRQRRRAYTFSEGSTDTLSSNVSVNLPWEEMHD